MSAAHVAFVVPRTSSVIAQEISRHGGKGRRLPDGVPASILGSVLSGLEGERLDVVFTGNGSARAAEALCSAVSEGRAPYVCVVDSRFDPSMCAPVPGHVSTNVRHASDDERETKLPLGFEGATVDERTLAAAGFTDAAAIILALEPEQPESFVHEMLSESTHA